MPPAQPPTTLCTTSNGTCRPSRSLRSGLAASSGTPTGRCAVLTSLSRPCGITVITGLLHKEGLNSDAAHPVGLSVSRALEQPSPAPRQIQSYPPCKGIPMPLQMVTDCPVPCHAPVDLKVGSRQPSSGALCVRSYGQSNQERPSWHTIASLALIACSLESSISILAEGRGLGCH